jgi:hypothetical protein
MSRIRFRGTGASALALRLAHVTARGFLRSVGIMSPDRLDELRMLFRRVCARWGSSMSGVPRSPMESFTAARLFSR